MSVLLLLTVTLLNGCVAAHSELNYKASRMILPTVKEYSPAQQNKAADEMEAHCNTVPMLCDMMIDFGKMRDKVRAAQEKRASLDMVG